MLSCIQVVSPPPITSLDRPFSCGLDRGAGTHCDIQEGQRADAYDDCRTDSASMKLCESAALLPLLLLVLLARFGIDWAQELPEGAVDVKTLPSIGRRKRGQCAGHGRQCLRGRQSRRCRIHTEYMGCAACRASASRYSVRNILLGMWSPPTDGSSNLPSLRCRATGS